MKEVHPHTAASLDPPTHNAQKSQRLRLVVQGIVQGVGFRPFVYGLAMRWKLAGFVRNDSAGVTIEIEGQARELARFQQTLREEAPPLARIDTVVAQALPVLGDIHFVILESQVSLTRHALVSPDVAICNACLRELFDPADRRYRYPFINCTDCGPRFTIIEDLPYDRQKTTMRVFSLCPECLHEYRDPLNRRFHAQPNACPCCGPHICFSEQAESPPGDAIAAATQTLARGAILALKGLGGYHLACDALDQEAVLRLRRRKGRQGRPLAVMVPDLETARKLCEVSEQEATLLQSPRRPIVLLPMRCTNAVAPAVAPGCDTLGVMLPYTPLHALLLKQYAESTDRMTVLVMTSGNLSDEPIIYRDEVAAEQLRPIADGILTHNREIETRCDDSVLRVTATGPQFLRRSRGYTPEPISCPWRFPLPVLACGAQVKQTFCLGKGHQAFLSQHIGDLSQMETFLSFRESLAHFQRLFAIHPEVIAYDLHPQYLTTTYALSTEIPQKIGIQHHHAHIASVMAEHGLSEPLIGIAADGTGYGTDGALWGCEILVGGLCHVERFAHLAYVPLPGGEQAVRQCWRMAAVYLARVYGDDFLALPIPCVRRLDRHKWQVLSQMIAHRVNSPLTSSLGRLFDAVAALLDLRDEAFYEGQAASELEVQARLAKPWPQEEAIYPFHLKAGESTLDVLPMIQAIVQDLQQKQTVPLIAWRFHVSLAELLAQAAQAASQQTGLTTIALSGGVFQNRLLLTLLSDRLHSMGYTVYTNQRVPSNDGGISLGQAAIAAWRLRSD
ncbi:MAG TPA: carbamoyltransferase HypF [Ktedonobacteraceae bacterium]|jgi:hydrogenase maturation protein HypF